MSKKQKGISFEERVENAIERIKNGENNGGMEFSSRIELVDFLGINRKTFKKYEEKLKEEGFVFPGALEQVSFRVLVKKAIGRIENGENNGGMEFSSRRELMDFLGASGTSFRRHSEMLKREGFVFPGTQEQIQLEVRVKNAKERIENGENNGGMEFSSRRELMDFLGTNKTTFKKYEEKLKAEGFVFSGARGLIPFKLRVKNAKERIVNGENGGSMDFPSPSALADFLGTKSLKNGFASQNEEVLKAEGFVFPEAREIISIEVRIENAKKRIENGENGGSMEFYSQNALSDFFSVSNNLVKRHEEKLKAEGFVFPEVRAPVSRNIIMTIEGCKDQGVFLESAELLPDVSKEFFGKHIRPPKDKDDYKRLTVDVVKELTRDEKYALVKECIVRLLASGRADYSMLELKLELFVEGIYLSEKTIIEAMISSLEDIDRKDSIQKRLRLCSAFVDYGLIEVEYRDALPMINNSIDGNVIIDKRINNKKTLIKLWKEYALYSIKNDITGHVSKTEIPDDWDGKLDSLFSLNSSYEKAYLLDDESIWFLKESGYEGLLAMCQFGSKQSKKVLTQMHHSIHARCIGFFMYLNRKKYALLQPKFIIFTGADTVSSAARAIMDNHVVMCGLEDVLKSDDVPEAELKKIKQKNVDLLAMKFAGSVLDDCDLSAISSRDLYVFLDSSSHEAISGTIILETLALTLLRNLGNRAAIKKKKEFDFDSEVLQFKHASKLNESTLKNYKKLLNEMIDVVRKRHESRESNGYVKKHLSQVFVLMRFLDTFPKKLNRKEMVAVLNTVIKSGVKNSFTVWGKENLSDTQYSQFTRMMPVVFEHISDEEYKGLYPTTWVVKNNTKTKTIIREGMNAEAYKILQNVAIYDPPRADGYPFPKTTPGGEQLDLSWWPHNFSPIPVICNWLIVKTTRRKMNVRHLDVNSFLHFDTDGELMHMHFNTDKNRKTKEKDISIHLLRYLFTPEELEMLKKYVDYIKNAYSYIDPVSYESSAEEYEKINPLFPHHKDHAVIAENWLDGYHIKTMLKTEMILKKEALKDTFDSFIEEQDRERRTNDLVKAELVTVKPSSKKELPKNIEDLDSVTLPGYASNFSVKGGVHNMRHAGISALGAELPLVYVRLIAGHSSIVTTANVYFHANDDIIEHAIKAVINAPVGSGSEFIRESVMPHIKSDNPAEIEQILVDNHFMTASREVLVQHEVVMVEDGLTRGSEIHPSLWSPEKHGVCLNNKQCPPGTNGCCALCPFNAFSPMHLKGVLYELNACSQDITLISQKVALDARDGVNITREEMKDAHQQKFKEMAAWFEILIMINEKMKVLGYGTTENLPVPQTENTKDLYSVGALTIDETMMELLVEASALQINDIKTDDRIARMSHKFMQAAVIRKDHGALDRMANEGIGYIVDTFGKKALGARGKYLMECLETEIPVSLETVSSVRLPSVAV